MERRERIAAVAAKGRERLEKALPEFGGEKLTPEVLAPNFNLDAKDLTPEDLQEIHEFAVNAGIEMTREGESSNVQFLGHHDIFHAAEQMRLSKGQSATAEFVTASHLERYTKPSILLAELYPILFFGKPTGEPLSIAITTLDGREKLRDIFPEAVAVLGENIPESPQEAKGQYEAVVKAALLKNGRERLAEAGHEEMIPAFEEATETAFAETEKPEHYEEFAEQVFRGDYEKNPRLFIDRFLEDIKTVQASS